MDLKLGTIESVSKKAGVYVASVRSGPRALDPVSIYPINGVDFGPREGDRVVYRVSGSDRCALAVFSVDAEGEPGDAMLLGRGGDGEVVCKFIAGADGSCRAENGSGFFELSASGQFNANNNFTVDP